MDASAFDRAAASFRGELSVAEDGTVEGFCVDPARPGLRCEVEIMVEDRMVARVLARELREDLVAFGFADGAHGFRVRLPEPVLPRRPEVMVWARVRGARRGFAQRLLVRPLVAEAMSAREAALTSQIDGLSDDLAGLMARPAKPLGAAWRDGLRAVAARAALLGGHPRPVAALPFVRRPALTIVLPPLDAVQPVLRLLAWLAPVARALSAEVLALHEVGAEPYGTLGGLVPNLRLAEPAGGPLRAAAMQARGDRVALLDPQAANPSRAVLEHVLRSDRVVFGPAAPQWLPGWSLPASPGVLAVLPRGMLDAPDWSGVLSHVRAAGSDCVRVEL